MPRRLIACVMVCFYCLAHSDDAALSNLSGLALTRYGETAQQNVIALSGLLIEIQSAPTQEKLARINDFFNTKLLFVDDIDLWGESDYWATPLESIGKGAGDCEDFTIAKYIFLRLAMVSNDKLRLTYVKATLVQNNAVSVRAHMVLSYYPTPNAEPLILDNLNPQILPASQRKELSPIFSFNNQDLWVAGSAKPKSKAKTHLSKWRDLLNRTEADGLK